MLEAGLVVDPTELFWDVFGQQLEGIGKLIICFDNLRGRQYMSRIWCIYEVFVAVKRHIPITLAIDERDLAFTADFTVNSGDFTVDSERATASVQSDADMIKSHIMQEHGTFQFVNEAVEQLLWKEFAWFRKKGSTVQESVESVREASWYLGVSLDFVLAELKCTETQPAQQVRRCNPGEVATLRDGD
eukprot:Skav209093  [mRNA]  locus=scaffold207:988013:991240:- [translate_table: standard]